MSDWHPFPASEVAKQADLDTQALPGVTQGPLCPGCGQGFRPARSTQRHCRPGCRVAALRKRRSNHGVNDARQIVKNEAADSSQEPTAESRLRGNLPSRTSETS
jgi:hypothetical protein